MMMRASMSPPLYVDKEVYQKEEKSQSWYHTFYMKYVVYLLAGGVLFLGVGCANPLAVTEKAATDVAMSTNTTLVLEETTAGLDNPFTQEPTTQITIADWNADSAKISWKRTEQQETSASKTAREQALSAPVGSGVEVPEIQYEDIAREGSLQTDGMQSGTHLAVPSTWQDGEHNLSGQGNSLLWLSQHEYETLITTRHATVTIGELDSLIATLLSYYDQASGLLAHINGNETSAPTQADVSGLTTLSADADWGSYDVMYGDEKVRVQTVVAENAFAQFEILANPQNPLVLSVTPRPASWVMVALETLHANVALAGYKVTQISPSSVDQLQLQGQ